MGKIQYTQLTDKQCCYGSSNKVYNIPVGATVHEIATITGVSIQRAFELQEMLLQDSVDCNVFLSRGISEQVVKNNCFPGIGSVVNVTIPEGQFSSQFSQEDADSKAIIFFDENKQGIANKLGNCTQGECLDCDTFRISRTSDCGEYRINTLCIEGVCSDTSSEYFVCTGNCKNETCIEECVECSFTCLTGSCPEGYNCINGQCEKDCTGEPCSQECPNNDTDNLCTECINGTPTNVECQINQVCVEGNCCTPNNTELIIGNCCEGLFLFEGICKNTCPHNLLFQNNSCIERDFCNSIIEPSVNSLESNFQKYLFKVNRPITAANITLNAFQTTKNQIKISKNEIEIYNSICTESVNFWTSSKQGDLFELDVQWNCDNKDVSFLGRIETSCSSAFSIENTPLFPQIINGDINTENFNKYYISQEDANVRFDFDGLDASNRINILLNQNLVFEGSTSSTTKTISKTLFVKKGSLIQINIIDFRAFENDSVAENGTPFNGWILTITKQ